MTVDPKLREAVIETLADPLSFPIEFRQWLVSYNALNPPEVPIAQIPGFFQFVPQTTPQIAAYETTTSNTYTDLATSGPEITALGSGRYLIVYSVICKTTGGFALAAPGYGTGGGAAVAPSADDDSIGSEATVRTTAMGFALRTFSTQNNTTRLFYREATNPQTSTFGYRRLAAFKFANL